MPRIMIALFVSATLIVVAAGLPFNLASRYYEITKTEGPVTTASTLCKVVDFREEAPGVLVGINVGVLSLNPDKSDPLADFGNTQMNAVGRGTVLEGRVIKAGQVPVGYYPLISRPLFYQVNLVQGTTSSFAESPNPRPAVMSDIRMLDRITNDGKTMKMWSQKCPDIVPSTVTQVDFSILAGNYKNFAVFGGAGARECELYQISATTTPGVATYQSTGIYSTGSFSGQQVSVAGTLTQDDKWNGRLQATMSSKPGLQFPVWIPVLGDPISVGGQTMYPFVVFVDPSKKFGNIAIHELHAASFTHANLRALKRQLQRDSRIPVSTWLDVTNFAACDQLRR